MKGLFNPTSGMSTITDFFGTQNIFFMNHARTGLRLLLNSLRLPPNARIGVQILNCHTVFNAIVKAGYKPVFIDISENLTMSIDDLQEKMHSIDALIVTHLFGFPAPIKKIKELVKDMPIIEDCAHSFLSRYEGKLTGTLGDASVFSFGKGKFPSIGSGGFVIINNSVIYSRFKELFSTLPENSFLSEIKNITESMLLNFMHNRFFYRFITFPIIKRIYTGMELNRKFESTEKMVCRSNLVLFLKKFKNYESEKERQVYNSRRLKKILNSQTIPEADEGSEPNYFMLPVISSENKKIIEYFFKLGVEAGPHFYKSLDWAEELGNKKDDCRNAERVIPQLIVIPTYKPINS